MTFPRTRLSLRRPCSGLRKQGKHPALGSRVLDPSGTGLQSEIVEQQHFGFDRAPERAYLSPAFLRMMTVLRQQTLGLKAIEEKQRQDLLEQIERIIKHYFWHGNVFQALQHIEFLQMDVDCLEEQTPKAKKLQQSVEEFLTYIQNNGGYIPNHGELYRCEETISSSFVESTGQLRGEQTLREEASHAVEPTRRPSITADAHEGAQ